MTARTLARTDISIVGRWWWTVDKWLLATVAGLILVGIYLTFAADPPAAGRIGVEPYHFVKRQLTFLPLAVLAMFLVSLLSSRGVRRLAAVGFVGTLALMLLTLAIGPEIKGAHRWLNFGGMSLQPSEFVKPFLAVTAAWMFAEHRMREGFKGNLVAMGLLFVTVVLLLSQRDVGMTLVCCAVWAAQFFIAGLPIFWVVLLVVSGMAGIVGAYFTFDHVQSRVDRFLDPTSGDSYQVETAMRAFAQGGLFGRGPGEGHVKEALPDAHTDFIFAVAGEEFGILLCLAIVALFTFLVLRALKKAMNEESLFVQLAVGGIAVQFGLQAMINMMSSLSMIPTKGMTLPFISYGGSSLVALGVGMGMLLALTRRRRDQDGT